MGKRGVALSAVLSRAPDGLSAPLVRVEVHLGEGLPAFFIVGLPEAVVRESRERVRAALLSGGFEFPGGRITVNLAPADLPKAGGRFDLPIAIGILAAAGRLPNAALAQREFYGELSLSGELRETTRLLPALIAADRAGHEVVIPAANAADAALLGSPRIRMADKLSQVVGALARRESLGTAVLEGAPCPKRGRARDLAEVRGQSAAKRALEIAAAGSHALLLVGPPGAGKTMLAQCLPALLPPLEREEALQVAAVASAAGVSIGGTIDRPFRNPQHTASVAALIGGGARMRPGEFSLAHHGVLFLDELPEFSRDALEALREPIESGLVVLSRAKCVNHYPARFQFIAAMNPCPCGYLGDARQRCRCTAGQVRRYRGKLSGPLLDRIDMHVLLQAPPVEDLMKEETEHGESSAAVAARVVQARARQLARQGQLNSDLNGRELAASCNLDRGCKAVLSVASDRLGLSARGHNRLLKIARTCADLSGHESVEPQDISEAIGLRALDRESTDPTCPSASLVQ